MADTQRVYRNPNLEIDPMTVSAAETQRIARKMREGRNASSRTPSRLQ
jgi:hypothetical protein